MDKLAKKMLIIFLQKSWGGNTAPTNFLWIFFQLFAYRFAYFGVMKTENPEENKTATH